MKKQQPKFDQAVCKGSMALGTHCGHCQKCAWERDTFGDPRSSPTAIDPNVQRDLSYKPRRIEGAQVVELPEPKEGMRIVDMCIYRDRLIVATERGVYERIGDTFFKLKFVEVPYDNPAA